MRDGARIELSDSMVEAMAKLAEGNPGAIAALMDISQKYADIDPESAFGPLSPLFSFDTNKIYGSAIYVLWNDKCRRDARRVAVILRATQLGFFSHVELKRMADDQMGDVPLTDERFDELDKLVCERLEQFQKPEAA